MLGSKFAISEQKRKFKLKAALKIYARSGLKINGRPGDEVIILDITNICPSVGAPVILPKTLTRADFADTSYDTPGRR